MQCTVHWGPNSGAVNKPQWSKAMEEESRRERRRRQRQKVVSCCKKFVAFLFSHIGLAAMVVAYSIMGGFLFQALEAPYEYAEKVRIQNFKQDKIEQIFQLAQLMKLNQVAKENFTSKLGGIFLDFQQEVVIAVSKQGWDGKDTTDESALQWSFAGALLYAVTVITTIGYGHVAPKTTWGRLVTIVYALVGIPLTFLYLSNIGNFLADCFKMFYKKICCDICCCQKCDRKKKRERLKLRRRRELAAQRNTYVGPTTVMPAYNSPGLEPGLDSPGDSDLLTPDDVDLSGGLPGGDENLAYEDDPDDLGSRPTTPGDLPKRKTPDLRDLACANLDDMRETDILDDNYESKDDLRGSGRPASGPGDIKVSHSMLNRLDDARETDLIDDSDEDNERASPNGDADNKAFENDEEENLDNLPKKERKKREKSMKRDQSKETKRLKKEQKLKEKEEKELQKEREKEEKEAAKRKLIDEKEDEKKRKEEEKEEEKRQKEEEKLMRKNTKRMSRKDTSKKRGTRKDRTRGGGGGDESEGVSLSPLKREGSKKDDAKLKRKDSPTKRQRSLFRRKSKKGANGDGLDAKPFHISDDSFVTAQGDSMNTLNELSDGEQPAGGATITKRPLSSGDEDDDMVIDMTGGDSMEMVEYPDYPKDGTQAINYLDQDPFDYEEEEEDEKVTVPISICLIIIAGYIFAGSVLFTLWEDWDYLTGSYFCFITLSTIGFGDIVPGTDMKEWASHEKLVLCALWLAFGLSLLAMCFNLMQEEVKEKVKWLAMKIGLLKEDGDG